MQFEQENWEAALPYIAQAYRYLGIRVGSPNAKTSASYLDALIEKLGEARVQQILQQQNP